MEYKVFGCKVNKYYLNKWLDYFSREKKHEWKDQVWQEWQEKFIIATCVVTDRAKAKRIKTAKQQLKLGKHVLLTWCGAFDRGKKIENEKFYRTYPDLLEYQDRITILWEEPESDTTREATTHTFKSWVNIYTKKFIVIQNWCDSYCSFCLTVQKRGNHQTIPLKNIIEEINDFQDIGGKEIVLTGINLSAWGNTSTNNRQDNHFGKMLKELLYHTDIPRIRISSLGPEFLDDDFFEAIEDPRFLPHFHFSIQSFSTEVLKRMKRHYNYEHLARILTRTKQLKQKWSKLPISIWADIITSFPWETEQEFEITREGIEKFGISKLHAFPFSPHVRWDRVPAGFLDGQLDDKTKKIRQQKIISTGDLVRKKFIEENIWTEQNILLEEKKDGKWQWRSENYIGIKLEWDYQRGEVVKKTLSFWE